MKQDINHQTLEKLAREELNHSIEHIDDSSLDRLKAARKKAVDLVASNSENSSSNWSRPAMGWWLPAGGFAATAAAVTLSVSIWLVEPNELDMVSLEDMAVLSANEDLELFDELEFYQWLEHEKHSSS